jgi:hypothetical protein
VVAVGVAVCVGLGVSVSGATTGGTVAGGVSVTVGVGLGVAVGVLVGVSVGVDVGVGLSPEKVKSPTTPPGIVCFSTIIELLGTSSLVTVQVLVSSSVTVPVLRVSLKPSRVKYP